MIKFNNNVASKKSIINGRCYLTGQASVFYFVINNRMGIYFWLASETLLLFLKPRVDTIL